MQNFYYPSTTILSTQTAFFQQPTNFGIMPSPYDISWWKNQNNFREIPHRNLGGGGKLYSWTDSNGIIRSQFVESYIVRPEQSTAPKSIQTLDSRNIELLIKAVDLSLDRGVELRKKIDRILKEKQ